LRHLALNLRKNRLNGSRRLTWVSWHWHQRTESIVRNLGIAWRMLDTDRHGLARYMELVAKSLATLWQLRGSTIIVQSPSLILAGMAVALAPLLRLRVAVDAHNEAVQPFTHDLLVTRWLVRYAIRRAHLVIVTNEELAAIVQASGGTSFVLPDAIPVPPSDLGPAADVPGPRALVICTYSLDEPLGVYVETARRLQDSVEFRVTGRPNRKSRELLRDASPNLKVLGYLSHAEYWLELALSDTVIDLSLKPNCLVCGAYEAIGAGKSPIVSEGISNRRVFGEAASYAENNADALARAVIDSLANPRSLAVRKFRERYMSQWHGRLANLFEALDGSPTGLG
jgi:hypothetical protein